MPLVISHKAKSVVFVRSEEMLGEILGHSNFDGEGWAVGDRIVFEDGSGARIERHATDPFYVWSVLAPLDLHEVAAEASCYDQRVVVEAVSSWSALFDIVAAPASRGSFLRRWFLQK